MAKVIVISNSKGGVGKSTLVFLLSLNLCTTCKVAILDMDLQGSLSHLSETVNKIHITTDKTILEKDEGFDLIFVDTPPYLSSELNNLIFRADLIIVPTKAGILDLLAIQGTIDLISKADKESSSLIVLNMVKANTTLTAEILKRVESYDISVAKTHISDLVAFTRSIIVKSVEHNHNAQKQLDGLTKEVLTALL